MFITVTDKMVIALLLLSYEATILQICQGINVVSMLDTDIPPIRIQEVYDFFFLNLGHIWDTAPILSRWLDMIPIQLPYDLSSFGYIFFFHFIVLTLGLLK